jgi:tetratricopeptide (TPR) repeat protein
MIIKDLIWTPILVVLGACVVVYLPIRAAQSPWRNWGNPASLSALWDHLTGARIRSAFGGQMGGSRWDIDLVTAIGQLAEHLSWGGLVAIIGITYAGLKRPFVGLLLMLLWLFDLAFTVLLNPMGMGDHQTGLLTDFATVQAFAIGVSLVGPVMRRGFPKYGAATATFIGAIGLVTPAILHGDAARDNRRTYQALDLSEKPFDDVPPNSLLLVSSDDMASSATYSQGVENRRPDVAVVVKQHVADRDYIALLRAVHGNSQLSDSFFQAVEKKEAVQRLVTRLIDENEKKRAVYWELGDSYFDGLVRSKLYPGLPLLRLQAIHPLDFQSQLVNFRIRWRTLGYGRWAHSAKAAMAHRISLMGTHFMQLGHLWLGRHLASEAYHTDRYDAGILNNFAQMLQLNNQHKHAQILFEKLVSQRPGYALGWFNLGIVRFNLQDRQGMTEAFLGALQLGSKMHRVARMAWYTAILYARNNEFARAHPLLLAAQSQLTGSMKKSAQDLLDRVEAELARNRLSMDEN